MNQENESQKEIKCVIWDLDNTIWDGTLLEPEPVVLKEGVTEILEELDRRGILLSIASKNNHKAAIQQLQTFKLDHFFLTPEIGWNAKSSSISRIGEVLNLGLDTFLFIDDQPFELAEVSSAHPEVRCFHAESIDDLLARRDLNPRFITGESSRRRSLYREQLNRRTAEREYVGPKDSFLASLGMVFSIRRAKEADLRRAEELTVRTNQMNATGRTYNYDELKVLSNCPQHLLLICSLKDRFGDHGYIGLALIQRQERAFLLKLLLMSCRVMSHGVGSVLLTYVMHLAKKHAQELMAEFVPTQRNRMMKITYHFAGFNVLSELDGVQILKHDLEAIPLYPNYIELHGPQDMNSAHFQ
ncbi:MAG: HAD-IIIC family phosphatase [Verrucomicrobiota bacterium]